ncbi:hypothetical protein FSZ31_06530 [Sphingorhabdus soli]|uniref:ABC transporter permease n=1 Tax=Flavisphingopyxis soli TaxID=2601267 RepID=A0A5C6UMT1_9SPHN|nr:hypothetical protein [Sphingorhabdus soli]TXC74347.1 hypothetical protein FSZ31_06530 [Sphingorhabdus soli]
MAINEAIEPRVGALRRAIAAWTSALRIGWPLYLLELKARKRRHWIGLVWIFAPLLVVLAIGFGIEATRWGGRAIAVGMPYPVYIVTGLTFWQAFADAVLMPLRQFTGFRPELARGRMTVEQAIVVGLFDLAFATLLRAIFLLALLPWLGVSISSSVIALPMVFIGLVGAGLAIGVFAALPGLLIDDVGRALGIALALGMLASPVFYRTHTLDLLAWNPLAPWIDTARASVTGQPVDVATITWGLLAVVISLLLAAAWLRLAHRHFLAPLA